ncbi:GNAT family N-acetyltransferase [Candidatus Babela massiliensis]|uniref:Acetyltransferase GNAT family n=1 Tax=Candidatus Babela massiliensis TaxID=673862 RepID=V6DGR9_9BACT|nr:GNAT family N-acetyltransferase [Candidatus Babela massiliensis]CDK30118.1 Acetyltransferase GNAT family [Candidatus Babela massiliensis]
MMKKSILLAICVIQTLNSNIIIRPALEPDLLEIINLDRKVSWEYFKPIFLQYTGLPLAENPEELLEKDLEFDKEMFIQSIHNQNNRYLNIAINSDKIVGFIAFRVEKSTIYIELILVDKDYRYKKIGQRLIDTMISNFKNIDSIGLIVLDKNISAIKFYQTYGFKQQEMPKDINLPKDYPHIYLFYRFDV